ncbi:MAG: hypothetical protein JO091_06320 [Acidobacteriaceae bacterium]|nr:hypothetical protein [Acidobacteriaceae bacterium]
MPTAAEHAKRTRFAPLIIGAVVVVALLAALIYLNRPAPQRTETRASAEAKAYLPNLELSSVSMKATENFMKQQVVEIEGNLANKGPRALQSVDVYCLFYGVDGHEIHRERVPIIVSKGAPLKSGETRRFRMPFDTLPDTWNQALPRMVIAQITFAH